jgi:hypothetical protein
MVRTAEPQSENDRLAVIINRVAAKHGLEVYKTGWARTTYDINARDARTRDIKLLVRVESFATTNGEIRLFAPEAKAVAVELGSELEKAFPAIGEATIIEVPKA